MSNTEGELNAAISDFAAKLRGLVLENGGGITLNLASQLAQQGVFLPEYGDRVSRSKYEQLEELLGAEQTAHANTLQELERVRQQLDAERQARLVAVADLALIRGDLAVSQDSVVVSETSLPLDHMMHNLGATLDPAENADTNTA